VNCCGTIKKVGGTLGGVNLPGSNLVWSNASDAILRGADFSLSNCTKVKFIQADLREANLSGANLSGADLSKADLGRATLVGVDLSGAKMPDGSIRA
jgi:uncharacterized protein YjbI with pentapeptide repeats